MKAEPTAAEPASVATLPVRNPRRETVIVVISKVVSDQFRVMNSSIFSMIRQVAIQAADSTAAASFAADAGPSLFPARSAAASV
jgi:hypothetical protein